MGFNPFPTPTPIFPFLSVQGFPVTTTAVFSAWQHKTVSGKQWQTARQIYPNWEFTLQYSDMSWLREQTQNTVPFQPNSPFTEFEAISQLFLACYGDYGEFYYDDLEDDSRVGQAIGTGDGATTQFRVVRTIGGIGGNYARAEPVGGVNLSATINVYLNAVVQSPLTYAVTNDLSGSHLTFDTAPPSGQAITMDFSFYYRCRWLEDMQQYDQFLYNLFQLGKAKFRSVKP